MKNGANSKLVTMLNRLHAPSDIRHFVASSSHLDLQNNIQMINPLITFSWEKVQSWLEY